MEPSRSTFGRGVLGRRHDYLRRVPASRPDVRRATAADLEISAASLTSAFSGDPIFNWLVPKDVEQRLSMIFTGSLTSELAKPDHIVDVADDGAGVALWHDVDDWQTPTPPMRELLPRLFKLFGTRSLRAMRISPAMASVHPAEPHRYLHFIGVHRDQKGQGLGGALLTSMLDECDDMGLPAYLESSNPVNDAMYHRFGFQSRQLVPLPKGAPPMTAMWRDPR